MSVFVSTTATREHHFRSGCRMSACAAALMLTFGAGAIGPSPVLGVASAHDVVLHSNPADGARLSALPRRITLEFSAIPKESFNTIALSNADTSTVLFSGTPVRDKQMMFVDIPASVQGGDGRYTIGYQITSSDGHSTRGKLSFTVASDAGLSAQPAATPQDASRRSSGPSGGDSLPSQHDSSDAHTGLSSLIFAGVGLGVVALAIAFVVNKRRGS